MNKASGPKVSQSVMDSPKHKPPSPVMGTRNFKTAQDKTVLQRQIDNTDTQIDRLVYELYDLTDEEINIVEGKQA